MKVSVLAAAAVLLGCGRIHYDPHGDAGRDGSSNDAPVMDGAAGDASADASDDARAVDASDGMDASADASVADAGDELDATVDAGVADADDWTDAGLADAAEDGDAGRCVGGARVLTIAANDDDGEIETGSGTHYPSGESGGGPKGDPASLYVGRWFGMPTFGYFRFAIPDGLPVGVSVGDAELSLWGTDTDAWDDATDALAIYVERAADAPPVSGAPDAPLRATGRAVVAVPPVRWPAAGGLPWSVGWHSSPDLAAALEALSTEVGGVPPGGHVQLWVTLSDTSPPGDSEVGAADRSFDMLHRAYLRLSIACP